MNTLENSVQQNPQNGAAVLLKHAMSEAVAVAAEKSSNPDFSTLHEYAVTFLQETLSRQYGFQSLAHLQQMRNLSAGEASAQRAWEAVMQLRCQLDNEARAELSAMVANALGARTVSDAIRAIGELCWLAPQIFHAHQEREGVFKTWFMTQVILSSHSVSARKLTASAIDAAKYQSQANWLAGIHEFIPALHPDFFQLRDQLDLSARVRRSLRSAPEEKQSQIALIPNPTYPVFTPQQPAVFSPSRMLPN